jgi:threonine synthase
MPCFVSHLEGSIDGARLPAGQVASTHQGRPILVRYDLAAVGQAVSPRALALRDQTLWRYRELLPYQDESQFVSLGERMTPLLAAPRLAQHLGLADLWIKDESQLPTGSFKARGMALAVTMARELGIRRLALPTAGNAGGAAAAYAARAGLECFVFMPEDTPRVNQLECLWAGARVFRVNGLIHDCGRLVREGQSRMGWFDLSTLREPYRLEGKKTMGLELAEQMQWRLPDVILYPTGGGTGLVGMWKAFAELGELGWLADGALPRMVAVQSEGCCPIVRAWEAGARFAEPFAEPRTIASGIRVPTAVGDFLILDAVRASGGTAVAVPEAGLRDWMRLAWRLEGIPLCPEAAACVGAIEKLRASGWLQPRQKVVLFNTGAAQKYVEVLDAPLPRIDLSQPIDWDRLAEGG